ncbi:MAG TPA: hypothetical protein VGO86_12450 [Candidatus Dormibacteraeota bacterium]
MIIDILILMVVLGTAWAGFQRGLIQPLLAELFALGMLEFILHNRTGFADLMQALFHAGGLLAAITAVILAGAMGYLGARLGGSIRKMPVVTGVDGFFGVWLQALTGIGVCYVLISGVIVMTRAFTPLTGTSVNAVQLHVLERQLGSNAFTSSAIDGNDLHALDASAAKPGGVKVADLPGVSTLETIHRDLLQPQLAGSRLAPFVMNVGRRIPGLGPFGPRDLPKRGG